ncbi:hypothetical protein [Propionivibrio sp.]|uniref:hypothetical protein n=1 Tax=Propionivibrio sp. TaxID=2212460 RepID=UPI003BF0ECC5
MKAYNLMLKAAEIAQCRDIALKKLRIMIEGFPQERFVRGALARAEELWRIDPSV